MSEMEERAARLGGLQHTMAQQGVDLVAIGPTPNWRYLWGFNAHSDERLTLMLVSRDDYRLLVPAVNADDAEARAGRPVMRWQDEIGPDGALRSALAELGISREAVLAVDDTMRAEFLLRLQEVARPSRSLPAGGLMGALRMRKSPAEVETLAAAAALADRAVLAGAAACRPGVRESDVAEVIAASFRRDGADPMEFGIVASGPNGAFPHHKTGDRVLQAGDTIVMDIGAGLGGYKSDITRTVQLGEPSPEVRAVYAAVLEANRWGRAAAVAGARAREVDLAARDAITAAGYGPYFVHRTGHGIGLEVHEPPYITSESDLVLEPGMAFSVEPGIYLPGKFGVRIEDIVVVTDGEARRLTGLGHELIVRDL